MTDPAQIRRAQPDEAPVLTGIALAAKAHWGYPAAWIEAWRDDLTFTPAFIADHPVFVAATSGAPVGCYALTNKGAGAQLEHFWVAPAAMGRGIGRMLFEHAVREARAAGAEVLHIDSDPHAEAFYLKLGAVRERLLRADRDGVARARPQMRYALA